MFVPLYAKPSQVAAYGCALLNHHGTSSRLRWIASEIVRKGVTLRPPSVSISSEACTVEGDSVRIGLSKIKGIQEDRIRLLLDRRIRHGPFTEVDDLVRRVMPSHRELESLLLSGACDDLIPDSAENYPFVHQTVLDRYRRTRISPRVRPVPPVETGHDDAVVERYQSLVRVQNELLYLQMHVHAHPMAVLRDAATRLGCVDSSTASATVGRVVRFAGVVCDSHCVLTRDGLMQYVSLEDELGTLVAVLIPPVYRRFRSRMSLPGPFIASGTTEEEHGELQLIVSDVDPFFERGEIHGSSKPASSFS